MLLKNRLEELRKARGIRQEELADALEVSRQTIGSLENGRYNPSILLAFKIARYFKLKIEEVFYLRGGRAMSKYRVGKYVALAFLGLCVPRGGTPDASG